MLAALKRSGKNPGEAEVPLVVEGMADTVRSHSLVVAVAVGTVPTRSLGAVGMAPTRSLVVVMAGTVLSRTLGKVMSHSSRDCHNMADRNSWADTGSNSRDRKVRSSPTPIGQCSHYSNSRSTAGPTRAPGPI